MFWPDLVALSARSVGNVGCQGDVLGLSSVLMRVALVLDIGDLREGVDSVKFGGAARDLFMIISKVFQRCCVNILRELSVNIEDRGSHWCCPPHSIRYEAADSSLAYSSAYLC